MNDDAANTLVNLGKKKKPAYVILAKCMIITEGEEGRSRSGNEGHETPEVLWFGRAGRS